VGNFYDLAQNPLRQLLVVRRRLSGLAVHEEIFEKLAPCVEDLVVVMLVS
jgi:hypothetical protein